MNAQKQPWYFGDSLKRALLLLLPLVWLLTSAAQADHTPAPSAVVVAGDLQSELGCPGDWQPDCASTGLTADADDGIWQAVFNVPAGSWEYKAALNNSWDENYGAGGAQNGDNIGLSLTDAAAVKFYYDHASHWITDNHNSTIATVPGDFQSELGCPGDWDPACLRSWLQDPDGDGLYRFVTNQIPAGNYEAKVAINESWDENYGAGGAQNGDNIAFSVPAEATVTFSFERSTNILDIQVTTAGGHSADNNVEYFGLGHNSQDSLYRVPFGAVTPETEVLLRFRTYHNDVTGVRVRLYSTATSSESFQSMMRVASDVDCYDDNQPDERCDFWQTSYTPDQPGTLYYRFIITDGSATAYYDDDLFQDGGWGEAKPALEDDSYVITVYDPNFTPLPWLRDAVVYQIFPDRFRNGRSQNDPNPVTEPRYGYPGNPNDQILLKAWTDLPEGYCRAYENPAQSCNEIPRGRDYFGGDLPGLIDKLPYLQQLGVTVIYLNPIFEAGSDHLYDTQNYNAIDHFFGRDNDFTKLTKEADKLGINIILDGVFNHVSSDSPYFDRYGHFAETGACENVSSPYRDWFYFRPLAGGPCAGPDGPNTMTYDAWFGFDSLPVLNKSNEAVQALVYGDDEAVARTYLEEGAAGWRLDVMGDTSFPPDFWPEFREAVKEANVEAAIVGELWKKAEVLPKIHGDQADTTMNYRFRNAILGFFGTVDNKGFADDGQADQPPSLFARKLNSVREDYPDATYYALWNIMDSHDTKRILWSLTPGQNNREAKEFNADNLAAGKARLRLARLVQMTVPGAPVIYYGDEVGLTGDDDPDDRRTFPWTDLKNLAKNWPFGAGGDLELLNQYRLLADLRAQEAVFRTGELTFLLLDDDQRTMAYLLRTGAEGAIVAINRHPDSARTLTINLNGLLPDDVQLDDAIGTLHQVSAQNGVLSFELPPLSGAVLLPVDGQDLTPPAAPTGLTASAGNGQVDLSWNGVGDAVAYRIYRSPVTGGGYIVVDEVSGTDYTDSSVINGQHYYYVVHAVDEVGNEGAVSNEAAASPAFPIGWAILQFPKTIEHIIGVAPTENIYGQVYVAGLTDAAGDPASILAEVGFGTAGSDPADWSTWQSMSHNVGCACGNNFEYMGQLRPEQTGTFDLLVRFSTDGGLTWAYGDQDGLGTANPGVLTVVPNADTTPPEAPTNLQVVDWSQNFINLAWDGVGEAAEYWLYRSQSSGSYGEPLAKLDGSVTSYRDTLVAGGTTYYYVVEAIDAALNRSVPSNEASQRAEQKLVNVTFRVQVPAQTPANDTIYLPGSIDLLGPWDPGRQAMVDQGGGIWEVTLQIPDGTQLEYKYTRGTWDRVEWWGSITGVTNRAVTISYGSDGSQLVDNSTTDWGSGSDTTKAVQFWRDPLVLSTSPVNGASGPAPANVEVTFDRTIQPGDSDFSNAIAVTLNGSPVGGATTPTSGNTTSLTWTPSAALSAGSYTVTVGNVRSSLGGDSVPMQQPYIFSFTVP